METSRCLVAAAVTLMVSGSARADFALTGDEHMDITSSHSLAWIPMGG